MSDKKDKRIKATSDFMEEFFKPLLKPEYFAYDDDKIYKREIIGDPPKIKQSIKLKGAGRNKKDEVPQSHIKDFVKTKLSGESRRNFIHQNNRYNKKGKPIWNKLADTYLKENPHIDAGDKSLISKKGLKDRIKEAYNSINQ